MIFVNRWYHPLGLVKRAFSAVAAATVRCVDGEDCAEMDETPRFTGFGPPDYEEFEGEFCRDCLRPELRCRCQRGDA